MRTNNPGIPEMDLFLNWGEQNTVMRRSTFCSKKTAVVFCPVWHNVIFSEATLLTSCNNFAFKSFQAELKDAVIVILLNADRRNKTFFFKSKTGET